MSNSIQFKCSLQLFRDLHSILNQRENVLDDDIDALTRDSDCGSIIDSLNLDAMI